VPNTTRHHFEPMAHQIGIMSKKNLNGSGRLVPTRPTGVEYKVHYGIHLVAELRQHGRGLRPTRWEKCSLRSASAQRIPDGSYFLHADDGRVHQLKSVDGQWQYLAVAA
jgi:hypothetical protein